MSIHDLLEQGRAGFTVYSPDCAQSRLWGNLDHTIHETTGFQPIYRLWFQHDYNTIMRFYAAPDDPVPPYLDPDEGARKYESVPVQDLKYGHLVGKLFLSGPSLLTLWRGESPVIPTLLALKGRTHPAQAASNSIRGRFWCDNGVCNLLHVSDDYAEARRELSVLNLWERLGETDGAILPLFDPISPTDYVAHSGIVVAADVVKRLLLAQSHRVSFQLPPSGEAKETNRVFSEALQTIADDVTNTLASRFITAYLSGDVIGLTEMFKQLPLTAWEKFVLQCGAITRHTWTTV